MSESDASETGAKSGKMKGILGFILSLVSIILGSWVIGALYVAGGYSTGVAAIGLLLPILAVILSVMGMSASKKAGEKKGACNSRAYYWYLRISLASHRCRRIRCDEFYGWRIVRCC